MSQRALRSRTVDIVSEEMDLGSREKSPDLEELETEGFRPDVNEVNKEAKDSQSVLDVEVPNLQIDSSDKDQNSDGDETLRSEITILMNVIQQQFQELKEGQKQAREEMKEGQKQAQEEMKERVKQVQEKTDRQFQELKNRQKQAPEEMKEVQKRLKEGLQKDINQVLLECQKSRELLKQELLEKLSAEIGKITIDVNQVKREVKKCENKLEREMIGMKQQFEKEREEQDLKVKQLAAHQEAEILSVKQ
jgi:hypothetical protein